MQIMFLGIPITEKQIAFIGVIGFLIFLTFELLKLDFFIPLLIWLSLIAGLIWVTYFMIQSVRSGIS